MVERAQNAAADDAREQRRRCDHGEDQADARAFADAPAAELVRLDVSLVVEDEDADGIELDRRLLLVPLLQRLDRIVRGCLVVEEPKNDRVSCHAVPPVCGQVIWLRAGGF